MPYFPLIHAPVHYSRGRRSTPLISRLRTKSTLAFLHRFYTLRYLFLGTCARLLYLYYAIPHPRHALYPVVLSATSSRSSSLVIHPPLGAPRVASCHPLAQTYPLVPLFFPFLSDDSRSFSLFLFLFLLERVFCRLSCSLSSFRVPPASRGL